MSVEQKKRFLRISLKFRFCGPLLMEKQYDFNTFYFKGTILILATITTYLGRITIYLGRKNLP